MLTGLGEGLNFPPGSQMVCLLEGLKEPLIWTLRPFEDSWIWDGALIRASPQLRAQFLSPLLAWVLTVQGSPQKPVVVAQTSVLPVSFHSPQVRFPWREGDRQ